MNKIFLIAMVASLTSLLVSLSVATSMTPAHIDHLVDERIAEREQQLVVHVGAKLARIEKDLGVEPTNPKTLEDLGNALARLVFMPGQIKSSN